MPARVRNCAAHTTQRLARSMRDGPVMRRFLDSALRRVEASVAGRPRGLVVRRRQCWLDVRRSTLRAATRTTRAASRAALADRCPDASDRLRCGPTREVPPMPDEGLAPSLLLAMPQLD